MCDFQFRMTQRDSFSSFDQRERKVLQESSRLSSRSFESSSFLDDSRLRCVKIKVSDRRR